MTDREETDNVVSITDGKKQTDDEKEEKEQKERYEKHKKKQADERRRRNGRVLWHYNIRKPDPTGK